MIGVAIDLNLDRLPAAAATDLRRKGARDYADAVLSRARALPAEERALLHAIYAEGRTATEIATLRHEDPRNLRRRVRVILKRLRDPLYAFILRQRPYLSPVRRRVATLCILHGHSIRAASERTGLSMHAVRKHLHALHALHEAAETQQSRPPNHPQPHPPRHATRTGAH